MEQSRPNSFNLPPSSPELCLTPRPINEAFDRNALYRINRHSTPNIPPPPTATATANRMYKYNRSAILLLVLRFKRRWRLRPRGASSPYFSACAENGASEQINKCFDLHNFSQKLIHINALPDRASLNGTSLVGNSSRPDFQSFAQSISRGRGCGGRRKATLPIGFSLA